MASKLEVIDSVPEHVPYLAEHMREADKLETYALAHQLPAQALFVGICLSPICKSVMVDGRCIAMFGCGGTSLMSSVGVPGLLMTDEVYPKHVKSLGKVSRQFLKIYLEEFPVLMNYVHAQNTEAIKYLKWLGFKLDEPIRYGIDEELFHRFEIRRK